MEVVQGFKKNEIYYIFNGFLFIKSKQSGTRSYLKCKDWSCGATGVFVDGVFTIKRSAHNHEVESTEIENLRFRQELRRRSIQERTPLYSIFLETEAAYPTAAALVGGYNAVQYLMRRARQETQPPTPNDLNHFEQLINDRKYNYLTKEIGPNQLDFFKGIFNTDDGSKVVYFSSPSIIQTLRCANRPVKLFMDATFKVVPRLDGLTQLFTVHCALSGRKVRK